MVWCQSITYLVGVNIKIFSPILCFCYVASNLRWCRWNGATGGVTFEICHRGIFNHMLIQNCVYFHPRLPASTNEGQKSCPVSLTQFGEYWDYFCTFLFIKLHYRFNKISFKTIYKYQTYLLCIMCIIMRQYNHCVFSYEN